MAHATFSSLPAHPAQPSFFGPLNLTFLQFRWRFLKAAIAGDHGMAPSKKTQAHSIACPIALHVHFTSSCGSPQILRIALRISSESSAQAFTNSINSGCCSMTNAKQDAKSVSKFFVSVLLVGGLAVLVSGFLNRRSEIRVLSGV